MVSDFCIIDRSNTIGLKDCCYAAKDNTESLASESSCGESFHSGDHEVFRDGVVADISSPPAPREEPQCVSTL